MFEEPKLKTKWNVLSLGAGVQSSCIALMAAQGEISPMPDFAVFADTQDEPAEVMEYLEWLEKNLPYPVIRVTNGSLSEYSITPHFRKKDNSSYLKKTIPFFGKKECGETGFAIGRACTADFKIKPIRKVLKEKCGIIRAQKDCTITQWIGISWDEMQRMKVSPVKWMQNRWPLIERKMSRHHCKEWMRDNGYEEPPRSACYYCPFHDDDEWRRIRNNDPKSFQMAVDFDILLREKYKEHDKGYKMEAFLHRSCKPLGEVDFDSPEDKGQETFDFASECDGMCGI